VSDSIKTINQRIIDEFRQSRADDAKTAASAKLTPVRDAEEDERGDGDDRDEDRPE